MANNTNGSPASPHYDPSIEPAALASDWKGMRAESARLSEMDCARLCFMVAVIAPDADETDWQCDECAAPVTDEDAILCADGSIRCPGCDEATIGPDALRLAAGLR